MSCRNLIYETPALNDWNVCENWRGLNKDTNLIAKNVNLPIKKEQDQHVLMTPQNGIL